MSNKEQTEFKKFEAQRLQKSEILTTLKNEVLSINTEIKNLFAKDQDASELFNSKHVKEEKIKALEEEINILACLEKDAELEHYKIKQMEASTEADEVWKEIHKISEERKLLKNEWEKKDKELELKENELHFQRQDLENETSNLKYKIDELEHIKKTGKPLYTGVSRRNALLGKYA